MTPVALFLEGWTKPLLVVHALVAAALLGSSTHAAYEIVKYLQGRPRRPRLEKLHATIVAILYASQMLLGALMYPVYRVRVRHEVFDAVLPWASNLFDIKEMFAAFGLGLVIAWLLLSRVFQPHDDAPIKPFYAFCGLTVAAIVWFNSLSGFLLTAFRAP